MPTDKQKQRELESKISDHKRQKKKLHPPLHQMFTPHKGASWINARLPEMLWASLAITQLNREQALDFFRHVVKYVNGEPDCYDVSLTGISQLWSKKRAGFIEYICLWSKDIKEILRPMTLFPDLPAYKDWKQQLGEADTKEDWNKVADAMYKCLWHQTQESTDCRWVRVMSYIAGEKMKFTKNMEHVVRGIMEYPNNGDMRDVRPSIRAAEIGLSMGKDNESFLWSDAFWKFCYDNTECMPEHAVNKKLEIRQKTLMEEYEKTKKHYADQTADLRNKLIDHFFQTSVTSAVDPRHEGAFGLTIYAMTLLIEIVFYRAPLSITARLALRSLAEAEITFAYLLKKETDEQKIWEDFRGYGTGQLKFTYMKIRELKEEPSSIVLDDIDYLANEDSWIEFVPVNLGHWNDSDLRKMSEFADKKNVYDKFYSYTSQYMHSNWGAIRESVFQKCINPLHRSHRLPTYDLPLLPSVMKDAITMLNNILDCLSQAYPEFPDRMKFVD